MDMLRRLSDHTSRIHPYIIIGFLIVLVSLPALGNDFLNIDDSHLIIDVPYRDLTVSTIIEMFSQPIGKDSGSLELNNRRYTYYRPMLEILYLLNKKVWGCNPVGFHLTNLLFHFISALLLYHICLRIFPHDSTAALIAAALFAVHPVHNEAIGRVATGDNLFGMLALVSVLMYLHGRHGFSWGFFALTLFTKESAVMLMPVIFLLAAAREGWKRAAERIIPYGLIVQVYLILYMQSMDFGIGRPLSSPGWNGIITKSVALADYLRLLVVPYPLQPFYAARHYSSLLQSQVLAAIGVLASFGALLWMVRKDRMLLIQLVIVVLLLMPALAAVNVTSLGAGLVYITERQLYLPVMFFSLFLADFTVRLRSNTARRVWILTISFLCTAFILQTVSAVGIYKNSDTIAKKIIMDEPMSTIARKYAGNMLINENRLDEAMVELQAALTPDRELEKILGNGSVPDDAEFSTTMRLYDQLRFYTYEFSDVYFSMGKILFLKQRYGEAIRKFTVAVHLNKDFYEARYYLGLAYLKNGQFPKASTELRSLLDDTLKTKQNRFC